jgi:hypothetical protein
LFFSIRIALSRTAIKLASNRLEKSLISAMAGDPYQKGAKRL